MRFLSTIQEAHSTKQRIFAMLDKRDQPSLISNTWVLRFVQMMAIVEADIRKLRHDPYELLTRMLQPAIWLLIFGQTMARTKAIPTGSLSYLDFIAPGILAQSVLFISIFYGIALIWERDMGVLQKVMVSPAPRSILVMGRAFAAGVRGLSQIFIVYFLSYLLGVNLRWDLPALLGVAATVMLGGAIFSTFSLIIASVVKKRERFMGIGPVMTMPLFFASNALYPIEMMPTWLQMVSLMNPLTYQVDALRNFMITDAATSLSLFVDFGVEIVALVILIFVASKCYPKILY
jgi:ABC-2 type transport system permease protein